MPSLFDHLSAPRPETKRRSLPSNVSSAIGATLKDANKQFSPQPPQISVQLLHYQSISFSQRRLQTGSEAISIGSVLVPVTSVQLFRLANESRRTSDDNRTTTLAETFRWSAAGCKRAAGGGKETTIGSESDRDGSVWRLKTGKRRLIQNAKSPRTERAEDWIGRIGSDAADQRREAVPMTAPRGALRQNLVRVSVWTPPSRPNQNLSVVFAASASFALREASEKRTE